MSKRVKLCAGIVLALGLMAALPGAAQARHWHGGWHHGWHHRGWHHGGWGGFGWGFGIGFGAPYYGYYYPPSHYLPPPAYYYPPRTCGWVRYRVRHHHRWYWRRVWRCW